MFAKSMFWVLKSKNWTMSFHASPEEALKKMHKAKEDYKEEFCLYGKNEIFKPFIEITSTVIYPEVLIYGKEINPACADQRNGN